MIDQSRVVDSQTEALMGALLHTKWCSEADLAWVLLFAQVARHMGATAWQIEQVIGGFDAAIDRCQALAVDKESLVKLETLRGVLDSELYNRAAVLYRRHRPMDRHDPDTGWLMGLLDAVAANRLTKTSEGIRQLQQLELLQPGTAPPYELTRLGHLVLKLHQA